MIAARAHTSNANRVLGRFFAVRGDSSTGPTSHMYVDNDAVNSFIFYRWVTDEVSGADCRTVFNKQLVQLTLVVEAYHARQCIRLLRWDL